MEHVLFMLMANRNKEALPRYTWLQTIQITPVQKKNITAEPLAGFFLNNRELEKPCRFKKRANLLFLPESCTSHK